jgi:hypothetical protein
LIDVLFHSALVVLVDNRPDRDKNGGGNTGNSGSYDANNSNPNRYCPPHSCCRRPPVGELSDSSSAQFRVEVIDRRIPGVLKMTGHETVEM